MTSENELETWRREIKEVDVEILSLVARRMQLALNIGAYKKSRNMPVKDYRVEKQVIEKAREAAQALGLYPILAEELMTTLIKYSVLKQDELKRGATMLPVSSPREALIIGGAGLMGRWFAQYFESLGFSIAIYDKRSSPPYREHRRLEEAIEKYQLILLATPMEESNELLMKLSRLPVRGTIIEICSLKSPISEGLQAVEDAGLKLASIHPMFGPDTDILAGKNILFCTGPRLCSEEVLQQHFQQTSAQLLCLPLEEHDRLMSYILGAAHLINLIYAQVLARSGESLPKLKEFGGTTFLRQLEVTSRVVVENQSLYFDIQRLNASTPYLLETLRETLKQFSDVIAKEDRPAFQELMGSAAVYFEK